MIKIRKLSAFLATANEGSASQGAKALNWTQPAVTSAIASLECQLGSTLFHRSAKGMSLTKEGAAFAERVSLAVGQFDQLALSLKVKGPGRASLHRLISETQLQAFCALCESQSYVAAAKQLGISQPAISRSVKDLEIVLGTDLWRRIGAMGEPTFEGRLVARAAGIFARDVELAIDELREAKGRLDGAMRIGALPLSRSDWVPEALVQTLKRFPQARISLLDGPYTEQVNALRNGRIDLIVGALRPAEQVEDLSQIEMFCDSLSIAVRPEHPILSNIKEAETAEWLSQQTWILPAKGTPGRDRFLTYLKSLGLEEPLSIVECGSLVATRALLIHSDFAAPLSARQIRMELEVGLLALATDALPGTERAIGIAMRKQFQATRLYREFITQLRANYL